jgi:hypothetical protein
MEILITEWAGSVGALIINAVDWPLAFSVLISGIVITDYFRLPVYRLPFAVGVWIVLMCAFSVPEWLVDNLNPLDFPRRVAALPVAMLAYEFAKKRGWIQAIRGRKRRGSK